MKKILIAALSILSFAGTAFCGSDNYPVATGGTQPRSLGGITFDGAFGNPALVGLDRYPRGGLSLLPTSVAMWSDKLALQFNKYLYDCLLNSETFDPALYLTSLFSESFGVSGDMDPDEVSKRLTEEFRDGIGLYVGARTSPLVFSTRGFALNVSSYADVDVRIPGGLLLPFFSGTEGLLAGNRLDLSDLRVEAIAASEVAVKVGFSTVIPAVRDHLKLDRGALGAGVKLIAGHSYFKAAADKNSALSYDTSGDVSNNKYRADAKVDVVSVGTGLHGDFDFNCDTTFLRGNPVSGQGWGLDLGAVFHNNRHMLSIDVQDIGMIFWDGKQTRKATFSFDKEFDVNSLNEKFRDLFDIDSLKPESDVFITWLPTALNVGYTYYYGVPKDNDAHILLGYLSASLNYRQQILLGPGKSVYLPRFSAGGALGLLSGFIPVRGGIILGGPERLASVAGAGIDMKYTSLDVSYKAVGSPILLPAKGFEAALALTFRWRWKPPRSYVKEPQDKAPEPEAPPPEPEAPPLPVIEEPPAVEEEPVVYAPVEIVLVMHAPPPPQPTVEETAKLNTSQRAINFRTGGADLTPGSFAALNDIAELLRQYPHIRYEIQGHTDSQGAEMYNLLLSTERAAAVKSYLVARGAPQESLIAIGYGENMPIADNATIQGRALNRRVEFVQIISDEQYGTLQKFETEMMRNITKRVLGGTR